MIKCDNNCEECGKYTTFHSFSEGNVFVSEYDCIVANKAVRKERERGSKEVRTIITK